ncbi:YbaB/EbfC family nucleoid-associated protein [Glycomyces sp. NRRL B-16210]|uniref:YbaB/EbfC family nucleoid-associated protein n=1 Tax=Glycomyces sp. NRRL B-16210 TaxID=1463821 RepID=UPI0004BF7D1B|nr:YbaB/EbfC family nucleoid-associated protein [Glycomyces sp. NRRL B-16210]
MTEDEVAAMQRRAQEVQHLAVEAEAEAVSEDGGVRVVAGPAGDIKVLDLRLNAFELSGVELGEAIVATVNAAENKAKTELSAEIGRILGTGPTDFGGGFGGIDTDTEGPR